MFVGRNNFCGPGRSCRRCINTRSPPVDGAHGGRLVRVDGPGGVVSHGVLERGQRGGHARGAARQHEARARARAARRRDGALHHARHARPQVRAQRLELGAGHLHHTTYSLQVHHYQTKVWATASRTCTLRISKEFQD